MTKSVAKKRLLAAIDELSADFKTEIRSIHFRQSCGDFTHEETATALQQSEDALAEQVIALFLKGRAAGLLTDDGLLEAMRDVPQFRGRWVAGRFYEMRDLALHDGDVWRCHAVTFACPGTDADWSTLGRSCPT